MITSVQKPAWLNDAPSFLSSRTYRFLRVFVGVSLMFVILNFYALDLRSHTNQKARNLGRGANAKIQSNRQWSCLLRVRKVCLKGWCLNTAVYWRTLPKSDR